MSETEDLRLKLAMYKMKTRKSYKQIAEELNIGYKTLTNFTSGYRNLTELHSDKLATYLKDFTL